MNASGNGVGGVGVNRGGGAGGGVSSFEGFGPGQLVSRQAKIAAKPDPNPKLRRRVDSHERRYRANQAIAVKTMQMPLRAIIGIAGIGFFLARIGTAEVRQQQNGDQQRENKTGHARREQSGDNQESSAHAARDERGLALGARISQRPAGDCYDSKKVIKDLREHAVDLYHA